MNVDVFVHDTTMFAVPNNSSTNARCDQTVWSIPDCSSFENRESLLTKEPIRLAEQTGSSGYYKQKVSRQCAMGLTQLHPVCSVYCYDRNDRIIEGQNPTQCAHGFKLCTCQYHNIRERCETSQFFLPDILRIFQCQYLTKTKNQTNITTVMF